MPTTAPGVVRQEQEPVSGTQAPVTPDTSMARRLGLVRRIESVERGEQSLLLGGAWAPNGAADYAGGIVPQELRIAVKDAYRAAQITQAQAATLLGLSRPHLAGRRVVPPPLQRPRPRRGTARPGRARHRSRSRRPTPVNSWTKITG